MAMCSSSPQNTGNPYSSSSRVTNPRREACPDPLRARPLSPGEMLWIFDIFLASGKDICRHARRTRSAGSKRTNRSFRHDSITVRRSKGKVKARQSPGNEAAEDAQPFHRAKTPCRRVGGTATVGCQECERRRSTLTSLQEDSALTPRQVSVCSQAARCGVTCFKPTDERKGIDNWNYSYLPNVQPEDAKPFLAA